MQDRVGAVGDPLDPHVAGGGMKEHQELGRATAEILMRITFRRTGGLPAVARLWNRLVGPCLILTPHGKPASFALLVSGLDQFFLAAASGSTTFATTG